MLSWQKLVPSPVAMVSVWSCIWILAPSPVRLVLLTSEDRSGDFKYSAAEIIFIYSEMTM